MGPMECYYLERHLFVETLEQNPSMALSLIRSLATMVRTADDWVARSI
jgi:CRP-like cAMP-binding protein